MTRKEKNGLITYDPYKKVANVAAFVAQTGTDIARSRMFGCETEQQGAILALECYATRTPPLSLAKRFDLIGGRLSMKADAMLADFAADGGEYDIVEYSPSACQIVFRYANHVLPVRITWDMAQEEKWPFGKPAKDGKPTLKTNWATPIGRQDMLWARVVSRGVRRVAPHIVAGRYTPDELADYVDVPAVEESPREGEVVDAEFKIVEEPQQAATIETPAIAEDATTLEDEHPEGGATGEQTERIRELCEVLSLPLEQQEVILARRGVKAWRSLDCDQAAELITKLESMVDTSQVPPEAVSVETDGAIDQALIDRIKQAISVVVQTSGVRYDLEVKKLLTEHSLNRLADLTVAQGQTLLKAIEERQLTAWAESALRKIDRLIASTEEALSPQADNNG